MKEELFELTNAQKRVFISNQLFKDTPINNITGYVIYEGKLDYNILHKAIEMTIQSMDSLSIRLYNAGESIKQYFISEEYNINFFDFSHYKNRDDEFQKHVKKLAEHVFGLYNSFLYRVDIFKLEDDKWGYAVNFHHLVSDGWTIKLLVERVVSYYEMLLNNSKDNEIKFYKYKEYLDDEKNYLNSKRAENHKKMILEQIQSMGRIEDYSIGNNCGKGNRVTKILTMEENNVLSDIIFSGVNVSVLFTTIFNLIIHYANGKVPPFLSVPIYNRTNYKAKETAGMFTSTMLLSNAINDEMSLAEVVNSMNISMKSALKYQRYPYNLIYNEIKNNRKNIKELFYFSVNCYNMNLETGINGIEGKYYEMYQGYQALPLQFIFKTWNNDETSFTIDYREDCFKRQDIDNIFLFLSNFITVYNQKKNITVKEFRDILYKDSLSNQKAMTLDMKNMVLKSFSDHLHMIAKCNGEKIAVYQNNATVSYLEFRRLIENAVEILLNNKIQCNKKVIFIMENSLEYVVYTLAAFIVRAVVIPLDCKIKEEKIKYIVDNCQADVLISKKDASKVASCQWINPVLCYQEIENGKHIHDLIQKYKDTDSNKKDIAYIIYTSGTTGNPKGVQIRRESIANYLSWAMKLYCDIESVFYMFSSPAFDLSITTLLLPYVSGKSSVIDEINNNIHLISKCRYAEHISVLKATPSQLELLLAQNTNHIPLEVIISGGEELTTLLANKLIERFGKSLRIYNEYGPTEATIGCMSYLYDSHVCINTHVVPIGLSTPGTIIYIVRDNKVVYGHEIGEMYIEGIQVASGYKGLLEKTKMSFVKMDFSDKLLYKTGDLAFWNNDWQLEFLGRKESQNKVNGFRVELNSIENVVKNLEGVHNCIVQVDKSGENEHIIAVVQTNIQSEENIREQISKYLPDYFIPHYIFIVENIPLAISGKVDYSFIQKLKQGIKKEREISYNDIKHEDLKRIIYQACEEVLHSGNAIDGYNYFSAGGDSIKALLINAKLQEYNIQLSLADILMYPEIDDMTSMVAFETKEEKINLEMKKEFNIPSNIGFLKESIPNFDIYIQSLVFNTKQKYSQEQISSAWNELLERIAILKYGYKDNKLIFVDYDNKPEFLKIAEEKKEEVIDKYMKGMFNVEKQLIKLIVFEDSQQLFFGIMMHHLLADGYTWKVLLDVLDKLLEGKVVKVANNCNYDIFADEILYKLINKSVKIDYGDYHSIEGNISIELLSESERKNTISKSIYEALNNNKVLSDGELWVEWDARKMENYKKYGSTLGCFSIFFPVTLESQLTDTMESFIHKSTIELDMSRKNIRLNYLGDVSQLVSENFELQLQSLDISLKQCAGYGCAIEITAYIQEDSLYICLCSRSKDVSELELRQFFDEIQRKIDEIQQEDLVELSDEEFDFLFN